MNDFEMKRACADRIEECFKLAEAHYGIKIERPNITWNLRGRTAGYASYRYNRATGEVIEQKIKLHPQMLRKHGQAYIDRTPGHEAAHVIAIAVYGLANGKGHGRAWKEVMRLIGQPAERCHSFDLDGIVKSFKYVCRTCGHEFNIGKIVHGKMQRGQHRWCTATAACKREKAGLDWKR